MKRLARLAGILLIATLCFGCVAASAQYRTSNAAQVRASRKADRKQRKAMKKYRKAQRKAQRKMVKKDRKNTHLPGNRH
jgi:hypothetical protein